MDKDIEIYENISEAKNSPGQYHYLNLLSNLFPEINRHNIQFSSLFIWNLL